MVKIVGTKIRMTRGDTLKARLVLRNRKTKEIYTPDPEDQIRFAMKRNYEDPEPILVKNIPSDTLLFVLDPEDTKDLEQPGRFVYDMELTHTNGDVETFIDKAKLILTEEVH